MKEEGIDIFDLNFDADEMIERFNHPDKVLQNKRVHKVYGKKYEYSAKVFFRKCKWGQIPRTRPYRKDVTDTTRSQLARRHYRNMVNNYAKFTKDSVTFSFFRRREEEENIRNYKRYDTTVKRSGIETEYYFVNESPVEAAFKYTDDIDTTILSVSSRDTMGGGFILGDDTSESRLCFASNMYNIEWDKRLRAEFTKNTLRSFINNGKCQDWLMFLHKVLFFRDNGEMNRFNVITTVAPLYEKEIYDGVCNWEARAVLEERLNFILATAERREITTLIISDWACENPFRHPPVLVAEVLKKCLKGRQIERVIFAIEDKEILRIFKYIFEDTKHEVYKEPNLKDIKKKIKFRKKK